ncbi:MAG: hypothetical protein R3242_10935 [Akkermansiaceae bacterium]|nr:hypothetical protein [Akkermansiaceae bacterium]
MATYQILFHGYGFKASLDKDLDPIVGFYTPRRVNADNPDEAYIKALELLKSEEQTKSLISESVSNGANPKFEADEIYEVSFWERLIGRCPTGFIFYDDSEDPEAH